MTKTEARKLAKRQLSYGHFRPREGEIYQDCPKCRARIIHQHYPWLTSAQAVKELEGAMVAHLVDECA